MSKWWWRQKSWSSGAWSSWACVWEDGLDTLRYSNADERILFWITRGWEIVHTRPGYLLLSLESSLGGSGPHFREVVLR